MKKKKMKEKGMKKRKTKQKTRKKKTKENPINESQIRKISLENNVRRILEIWDMKLLMKKEYQKNVV